MRWTWTLDVSSSRNAFFESGPAVRYLLVFQELRRSCSKGRTCWQNVNVLVLLSIKYSYCYYCYCYLSRLLGWRKKRKRHNSSQPWNLPAECRHHLPPQTSQRLSPHLRTLFLSSMLRSLKHKATKRSRQVIALSKISNDWSWGKRSDHLSNEARFSSTI